MTIAKPRFSKRVLLFVLLGLVTLLLYFYFFVGTVNFADVIGRTNLYYYAAAFIAFLVSVLFSSMSWHSLLNNLSIKIRIRRVLLFMWVGMFFDATVPDPGWSGDLSKAYMLARSSGQDAGRIVASVVSQKVIFMGITLLDFILGFALLASSYTLPSVVLIFIAAVLLLSVLSLIIVSYFSANPRATRKMLGLLIGAISFVRRGSWNSQDFRLRAEEILDKFHEGIRTLSAAPKTLVRPVVFSILGLSFDVSVIFLAFASLGYPVPADKVLIVYALTGSLQVIGVSFLGFTEIIVSGSYVALGIPAAISLSATLLTRVVTLWFKLAMSYVAFQWAGVGILMDKKPRSVLSSKPAASQGQSANNPFQSEKSNPQHID